MFGNGFVSMSWPSGCEADRLRHVLHAQIGVRIGGFIDKLGQAEWKCYNVTTFCGRPDAHKAR